MRRLLPAVLACLLLSGCGKEPEFLNGPTAMSALQMGSSIEGPLPEAWELVPLAELPDKNAAFYKIAQGSTSEAKYILRWGDDLLVFDETCLSGEDPQFLDFEGEGSQQNALILLCPNLPVWICISSNGQRAAFWISVSWDVSWNLSDRPGMPFLSLTMRPPPPALRQRARSRKSRPGKQDRAISKPWAPFPGTFPMKTSVLRFRTSN